MKSELYPGALIIEPMKINKIPEGKESLFPSLCTSGEYFAEIKKDGYWYMYEKVDDEHAYLFSRNISKETGVLTEKGGNVPHIMDALNCLPYGTIIIGEIYYPGGTSKSVTPIMGALPEKAIERQIGKYGYLHYYIHDILRYKNLDLTPYGASIRYNILRKVWDKYCLDKPNCILPQGENWWLELAERVDDNIQEAVAQALAAGEEGMVLKKKTAPYTPGKRPAWDTIKIKKTDTCDAVCMGWEKPTREYTGKTDLNDWPYWENKEPVTKPYALGWRTSMRIGAYDGDKLVEIGSVSSGLTDELRAIAGNNPNYMVGSVVELAGMEKDREAHTLRHFHFKRFREDKNAEECTIASIF